MYYRFLGPEHRANLARYRYSSGGSSFLSTYVLGPYWNWLVTLFPTSVAPNTITLSGLLLVLANFFMLLRIDGGLDKSTRVRAHVFVQDGELPNVPLMSNAGLPQALQSSSSTTASVISSPMAFLWAFCLFMYQSMDAIDGKQARRTGMSGPLGELFDHGCDALNTTLEVILASAALGFGRSYWTIACLISSLTSFFLTTWEEYHTHVLFLSSFSGPVEGILLICALYIFVGTFGSSICARGLLNATGAAQSTFVREHLAWANVPIGDLFMTGACFGLIVNAWQAYRNVRAHCARERKSVLAPLADLLPFLFQVATHVAWAAGHHAQVMVHGHVFMAFMVEWGLAFAYFVGLVILAHVSRTPYPYATIVMVPSTILAVDAWLPEPLIQSTARATAIATYSALAFSFAAYAYFVCDVIQTITHETGKPCFRVKQHAE